MNTLDRQHLPAPPWAVALVGGATCGLVLAHGAGAFLFFWGGDQRLLAAFFAGVFLWECRAVFRFVQDAEHNQAWAAAASVAPLGLVGGAIVAGALYLHGEARVGALASLWATFAAGYVLLLAGRISGLLELDRLHRQRRRFHTRAATADHSLN